MPGSRQKAQEEAPEADLLAVADGPMRESRPGFLAEDDRSACPLGELAVPAHEVGVKMGLEDPSNRQPLRPRLGDVLVHIAARIDDRCLAAVADEVRRVCQAPEVELLEIHQEKKNILLSDPCTRQLKGAIS